jgi:hypothetical protein
MPRALVVARVANVPDLDAASIVAGVLAVPVATHG